MSDRLDRCTIHGDGPCDCPAYLVTMGCMDLLIEDLLETDPDFWSEVLGRRLRGRDGVPAS